MVSNTLFTLSSAFVAALSSIVTFLSMNVETSTTLQATEIEEPVQLFRNCSEMKEPVQQVIIQRICPNEESSLALTFTNANLILLVMNFIIVVLIIANTISYCSTLLDSRIPNNKTQLTMQKNEN